MAAQIFTLRPKRDVTTARQTCELANLGVTTVTTHPKRRDQGRLRTTDTRPGVGGGHRPHRIVTPQSPSSNTSSRAHKVSNHGAKTAWMEVAQSSENYSQIKIWKSPWADILGDQRNLHQCRLTCDHSTPCHRLDLRHRTRSQNVSDSNAITHTFLLTFSMCASVCVCVWDQTSKPVWHNTSRVSLWLCNQNFRPFATCCHCFFSIKYTFSTFKMKTLH